MYGKWTWFPYWASLQWYWSVLQNEALSQCPDQTGGYSQHDQLVFHQIWDGHPSFEVTTPDQQPEMEPIGFWGRIHHVWGRHKLYLLLLVCAIRARGYLLVKEISAASYTLFNRFHGFSIFSQKMFANIGFQKNARMSENIPSISHPKQKQG